MFSEGLQNQTQMFSMLFFSLGVDKDIINEDNHELVEVLHEYLIHEIHEISRGIGQTKGHNGVFKQSVSGGEGGLGNVRCADLQLMITGPKVNLREYSGSGQLVE